jgi:hypothetical protein
MIVHPKSRKNVVRALFAPADPASPTTSTVAHDRHDTDARLGSMPASGATDDIAADDVGSDVADGGAAACEVCGHPVDGHDRIALRFCAATSENAITRACICPATDSPHPSGRP